MTFTHRLAPSLSVPDEEGRQYVIDFGEWKPFTMTFKPYLTPREEIPPAFRSRMPQLPSGLSPAYPGPVTGKIR